MRTVDDDIIRSNDNQIAADAHCVSELIVAKAIAGDKLLGEPPIGRPALIPIISISRAGMTAVIAGRIGVGPDDDRVEINSDGYAVIIVIPAITRNQFLHQ